MIKFFPQKFIVDIINTCNGLLGHMNYVCSRVTFHGQQWHTPQQDTTKHSYSAIKLAMSVLDRISQL